MSELLKPISVREGADEVKAKLKSDFSRITRVRRSVSIKPTMGCASCDATGKVPCMSCDGAGKAKILIATEAEEERCHTCDGTGSVTCVECAGKGSLPNVHRKKILVVVGIGAACWLIFFWQIWGRDVLPEQAASVRSAIGAKGGGRSPRASDIHSANANPGVAPAANPRSNNPTGQADPSLGQPGIR